MPIVDESRQRSDYPEVGPEIEVGLSERAQEKRGDGQERDGEDERNASAANAMHPTPHAAISQPNASR